MYECTVKKLWLKFKDYCCTVPYTCTVLEVTKIYKKVVP